VKKREFYDDAEKQLVEAYERDEFKPVKSQKAAKCAAIDAARRYMRKDARINIRLSAADLEMIKAPGGGGRPSVSDPDWQHPAQVRKRECADREEGVVDAHFALDFAR